MQKLTCIECPKGCALSVMIDAGKVAGVTGNLCPKGYTYAVAEIENPVRILTSVVATKGLSLKMIPVRTDRPIPKGALFPAMREIKKIKIEKAIHIGDIIVENILGLGANLVATRESL